MRNSYPSGLTGKVDPDLLIQFPGKTVFRIFHLKAQSGQVIADFITGSPILIGFGYHTLFQKHIHHLAESFFTSASASRLFFQTENVESKGMEHFGQGGQYITGHRSFLVYHRVDDTAGIEQVADDDG